MASPTAAPTRKKQKMGSTTSSPKKTPQPSPAIFLQSYVNIDFDASIEPPPRDEDEVSAIEEVWEEYILQRLQAAYRKDSEVNPQAVDLKTVVVAGAQQQPANRRARRLRFRYGALFLDEYSGRILQAGETQNGASDQNVTEVVLTSQGRAVLQVGSARLVQDEDLTAGVQQALDEILTAQGLTQALVLADQPAVVTGVENFSSNDASRDGTNNANGGSGRVPTTAELIVGFVLLGLTVLSLFFWVYVLWKKRRKRLRKRKQQELMMRRRSKIAMAQSAPVMAASPPQRGKPMPPMPEPTMPDDDSSSASSSPWKGLDSEDNDDPEIYEDDDTEDISEFGMELRRAVDLDNAAWEEFQRKKHEAENEEAIPDNGMDDTAPVVVVARARSALTAGGSVYGEEGIEVNSTGIPQEQIERIRSFPYGDEAIDVTLGVGDADGGDAEAAAALAVATAAATSVAASSHGEGDFALSLTDAVEWTAAGISLKVSPPKDDVEDDGKFEPYGDPAMEKKLGLSESWDLDENPVVDTDGPSAYSFMYPLQKREWSDNTQSTVREASSSDPSNAAVRTSPVSSWSTGVAGAVPPRPFPDNPDFQDDNDSNGSEEDIGTAAMLKEVMRLSRYVKRYEERKEIHRTVEQEILENAERNQQLPPQDRDDALQGGPYDPFNRIGSAPARESRAESQLAVRGGAVDPPAWDMQQKPEEEYDDPSVDPQESPSVDEDDDEHSQRLGISRYRVEIPPAPLLSRGPRTGHMEPQRASPVQQPPSAPVVSPDIPSPLSPSSSSPHSVAALPSHVRPGAVSRSGALSSIRTNRAFADAEESDETGTANTGSISSVPFDERRGASNKRKNAHPQQQQHYPKQSPKPNPQNIVPVQAKNFDLSPRTRTNNRNFNSIITMFEAKPKNAVLPPNEHVS